MIASCGFAEGVHNGDLDDINGVFAMPPSTAGTITGRPMSWEEFWALPEELRAEYVDGLVYVNPPATFTHQEICLRLCNLVRAQFGERCVIALATGWRLPTKRRILRIPDLMLLADRPEGDVATGAIAVAVEVVSTNRRTDLVRKATEYLEAGAGQYWIVDPRDREIDIFTNASGGWDELAHLSDDAPAARFDVPPFGEFSLSLKDVLG